MILRADCSTDAEHWSQLVLNSPTPDVYYLPAYVFATAELEKSQPLAIVTGGDEGRILTPMLIREMRAEGGDGPTQWRDACSPYGYGGMLLLDGPAEIPTTRAFESFVGGIDQWCREQNLVCCVIRLHPLLRQAERFAATPANGRVRICRRGNTSAIDLTNWDASHNRPNGMRKDRREDLNRAQRALRSTWKQGDQQDMEAALDQFVHIYGDAMEHLQAGEFYRFPRTYFTRLAALGSRLGISFVWLGDELVGANLFLIGWQFAHGHLAGTTEKGRKYGAASLLLLEGARRARERGCELLHLGGGTHPGDSLERFKRSFGGPSFEYTYVIYVADEVRFEQLGRLAEAPWPYRVAEVND